MGDASAAKEEEKRARYAVWCSVRTRRQPRARTSDSQPREPGSPPAVGCEFHGYTGALAILRPGCHSAATAQQQRAGGRKEQVDEKARCKVRLKRKREREKNQAQSLLRAPFRPAP